MIDYEQQLRFYSEEETRALTELYFQKYWLRKSEYFDYWLPTRNRIFEVSGPNFPAVRFRPGFEVIFLRGGCLFTKDDFLTLQTCLRITGDEYFVVVENIDFEKPHHGEPPLRFKYPADISWDELSSGAYVSQELLETPVKEYFVFGNTASWGRYSANDYVNPIDLVGFSHTNAKLFNERYHSLIETEIEDWIPVGYSSD
jgi:hypothetical protein